MDNRLVLFAPGVWTCESVLSMAPGLPLPLRMTVLRDADGGLTVVSPIDGISSWGPEVEALGEVRRIVAPNGYHHLFALAAFGRFGQAAIWASAALRDKRKDFPPQTQWLQGEEPLQLTDGLWAHPVLGMPTMQEWVLMHQPSATLVVTDLLFNLLDPPLLFGLVQRLLGTYKRLAVSRLFLHYCKDRVALAQSLGPIAVLPFERLVMAHGTPLATGAGPQVRAVLGPLMGDGPAKDPPPATNEQAAPGT